ACLFISVPDCIRASRLIAQPVLNPCEHLLRASAPHRMQLLANIPVFSSAERTEQMVALRIQLG
ncbi:hypothetical protein, partial [Nostoc sp. FACHB-888]|uniref:hypothetical protein n=1 Tax=Nostoc sp. FACHB-888 TaxID=2692842 RepID=UPI001A7EF4D3